jgi:hypothetical protein
LVRKVLVGGHALRVFLPGAPSVLGMPGSGELGGVEIVELRVRRWFQSAA